MSFASRIPPTDPDPEKELPNALAAVAEARLGVDAARRLAAERKCGASDVSVAEWTLEQALRRVDRLRSRIDWQGSPNDAA